MITANGVLSSWSPVVRPTVCSRSMMCVQFRNVVRPAVVGQDRLPGQRAEQEAGEERRDDQHQQDVLPPAGLEGDAVRQRVADQQRAAPWRCRRRRTSGRTAVGSTRERVGVGRPSARSACSPCSSDPVCSDCETRKIIGTTKKTTSQSMPGQQQEVRDDLRAALVAGGRRRRVRRRLGVSGAHDARPDRRGRLLVLDLDAGVDVLRGVEPEGVRGLPAQDDLVARPQDLARRGSARRP